ncbi:MAG: 4-phosphopantetheinyl transferase family protein [Polyangiaceae bacterium]|nr:4-phosphopantetheinyl transferase family protein [Polyangiaceae bacterium]
MKLRLSFGTRAEERAPAVTSPARLCGSGTRLWCVKEAVAKALGLRLAAPAPPAEPIHFFNSGRLDSCHFDPA